MCKSHAAVSARRGPLFKIGLATVERPPRQTPDSVTVEVPIAVIRALRPAARQRDTTVPRLIVDLVEVVAADDLFAALLDDDQSYA